MASEVEGFDKMTSLALARVLRLLSVGSKRFLTTKVDRSVTGLIAQQQCVGPLHTPLANYAIIAQSYDGVTGGVTAIGEQPIKGISNPQVCCPQALLLCIPNPSSMPRRWLVCLWERCLRTSYGLKSAVQLDSFHYERLS